jgi:hypothetical protein
MGKTIQADNAEDLELEDSVLGDAPEDDDEDDDDGYTPDFGLDDDEDEADEDSDDDDGEEDDLDADDGADNTADEGNLPRPKGKKQSATEAYTARLNADRARIQAEYEAQAKAREDAAFAAAFEGRIDPYSGKPIRNKSDYDAYKAAYDKEAEDLAVKDDPLANHPVLKKIEALAKKLEDDEAKVKLDADIAKITAVNPKIRSLADLQALPNFAQIQNLVVKHNHTIDEAYLIANHDALAANRAKAARQAALNNGKSHLGATGGTAGQVSQIPRDQLKLCLEFGLSAEEAQKRWDRSQRQEARKKGR